MALQPISNLGIAGPLSGTAQPNNFGAPANWVPGNGPPPGMTWSETQGQWMPSDSVVGAMPGPVASPIDNTLPIKFGMEPPNSNPYGFTAPTGPSTTALVPYYNTRTGQTWNAPGGGYTPPSADWIQGALEGKFMPMPGPNASPPQMSKAMPSTYEAYLAQQGPQMTMELKPWQQGQYAGMDPKTAYETFIKSPEAQPTPIGGTTAPSGGSSLSGLIAPTLPVPMPQQQPYMPIMGVTHDLPSNFNSSAIGILSPALGQQPRPMNNPAPIPQQPAPTPNKGGLGSLLTPQRPVQTPVVNSPPQNTGGLNSLAKPQTPINTGLLGSTQPVTRNQIAPRAGSLASLRIRPTFQRSLPVPFAKPPFRR